MKNTNLLLKQWREESGVSATELAKAAKCVTKTYYNWEEGTGEPSFTQLASIFFRCARESFFMTKNKTEKSQILNTFKMLKGDE